MDTDSYCREIEAYLCRRNGGHLVRVVGPAFEVVSGWAVRGIPMQVVCRGIDRAVERRAARGTSRRPLRVEFCEADVLDGFDQWRRAVGAGMAGMAGTEAAATAPGPRTAPGTSLRAHIDRVVTRLTDCLATGTPPAALEQAIERIAGELGEHREASRSLRGEARAALVARLEELDRDLLDVATATAGSDVLDEVRRDASGELAPFRARMPEGAYADAVRAAARKLLRERLRLPDLTYGPGGA